MNALRNVAKITKHNLNRRSSLSTVMDNTLKITFVDREGNRATVPTRVGMTILETAQLHKVDLEGSCNGGGAPPSVRRTENWVEQTFGEGPVRLFYYYCQRVLNDLINATVLKITDLLLVPCANPHGFPSFTT